MQNCKQFVKPQHEQALESHPKLCNCQRRASELCPTSSNHGIFVLFAPPRRFEGLGFGQGFENEYFCTGPPVYQDHHERTCRPTCRQYRNTVMTPTKTVKSTRFRSNSTPTHLCRQSNSRSWWRQGWLTIGAVAGCLLVAVCWTKSDRSNSRQQHEDDGGEDDAADDEDDDENDDDGDSNDDD